VSGPDEPERRGSERGRDADPGEVARLLLEPARRLVIASHRNADGDALGSMLGLARGLRAAGREAALWHVDDRPVPPDLAFLLAPGEEITRELHGDAAERTLVALDCASEERLADAPVRELAGTVVNIDHHHDNTRFGQVNLVDGTASSSAEMVVRVLDAAGIPLTPAVAEPLYVGLVTDTGRFGYSNATPQAHRVAARLIEAGLDVAALTRRLYEQQPLERARLLGRALDRARPLLGGRLVVVVLGRDDLLAAGAEPSDTEGIVEALRGVAGVEVAAFARETGNGDGGLRVSLRAASDCVDVSAIARAEQGGGHRAAAAFTTRRRPEELLRWLEEEVRAQLGSDGAPEAG
jgi:phosphoesterase RecJ-like protein